MARVFTVDDVRYALAVAVFEGQDDVPISFYVTEFERGEGTPLHFHPYPELFLVERNTALFTAGEEELIVEAGDFFLRAGENPPPSLRAPDEGGAGGGVPPRGPGGGKTPSKRRAPLSPRERPGP